MSGTFLDDLARTLAEPMPRRRALRLLGASVAIAAVPGLRTAPAHGAPLIGSEHCVNDQKECWKDIVNGERPHYCCPAPSWKRECVRTRNGYGCKNRCPETAKQFPCTATEEDPDAGINGECCNRAVHVGCNEVSIPARNIRAGTCATCPPNRPAICIPLKRGKGQCCTPGEKCCANDVRSVCCGAGHTCVYSRRRNGTLDPEGTVTCRCEPGRGTQCGPKCCEPGETCCGPPGARVCCPAGEFCFWKKDQDVVLIGPDFGMCKATCTAGNTAGRHCCGTGYRRNRRRDGCVAG